MPPRNALRIDRSNAEPGLWPSAVYSPGGVYFHDVARDGVNITADATDASRRDRPSTNFTSNFSWQAKMNVFSIEFIEALETTVGVSSAEIGRAERQYEDWTERLALRPFLLHAQRQARQPQFHPCQDRAQRGCPS